MNKKTKEIKESRIENAESIILSRISQFKEYILKGLLYICIRCSIIHSSLLFDSDEIRF